MLLMGHPLARVAAEIFIRDHPPTTFFFAKLIYFSGRGRKLYNRGDSEWLGRHKIFVHLVRIYIARIIDFPVWFIL